MEVVPHEVPAGMYCAACCPDYSPQLRLDTSSHSDRAHTPRPDLDAAGAPDAVPPQPPRVDIVYNAPPGAHQILAASSTTWFWSIILLLAGWMHFRHFTPHRAVDLMLHVLRQILVQLGALAADADAPVTLQTAMRRLQLDDQFCIRPMCPRCRRVHPSTTPFLASCASCGTALFIAQGVTNVPSAAALARPPKPKAQSPFMLPSQLIANLINSTPEMESELDKWRYRTRRPGKLDCMQDGRMWGSLPGPAEEGPFFDNTEARAAPSELRIGVTLGFDG